MPARYDRAQAIRWLHAFDAHLQRRTTLLIVGGMAAVLGHHAPVRTADIDVYELRGDEADIQQAAAGARRATGVHLDLGHAGIAELPDGYAARVRQVRGVRFHKLRILVPDKYDVTLSKALAGREHDYAAIEATHQQHPMSERVLARRFENEIYGYGKPYAWVSGDRRQHAITMVIVMRLLYGAARAEHYRKRWLDWLSDER